MERQITFEIERQDSNSLTRAGKLHVNNFQISTPTLWFGHVLKDPIPIWKNMSSKFTGLILNAYEFIKNPNIVKRISQNNLSSYLDYNGPILMDSGGFLFQRKKELNVDPIEILKIYEKFNVDIGVILDHPLDPTTSNYLNNKRWNQTLINTLKMISYNENINLMPVIHAYNIKDLKKACNNIKEIINKPKIIGLGSIVPLIKASYIGSNFKYRRPNKEMGNHITYIGDAITYIRQKFPYSLLHVFGVGGSTTAIALFYLGADSVDSVSWRLKAAFGQIQLPGISDRFLSERPNSKKSRKVLEINEEKILAECKCSSCANSNDFKHQKYLLDKFFYNRAIHNSWVYNEEIKKYRLSILSNETSKFINERISKTHRLFKVVQEIRKKADEKF